MWPARQATWRRAGGRSMVAAWTGGDGAVDRVHGGPAERGSGQRVHGGPRPARGRARTAGLAQIVAACHGRALRARGGGLRCMRSHANCTSGVGAMGRVQG